MEFGVTARVIGFAIKHSSFFVPRNANATLCTPHFEFSIGDIAFGFHGYLVTSAPPQLSEIVKLWPCCNRLGDAGRWFQSSTTHRFPFTIDHDRQDDSRLCAPPAGELR